MTIFERSVAAMIKPWVILSVFGLIILSILYLDRPIASYFHELDFRSNAPILFWITKFGLGGLYLGGLFLVAIFFRYIRPKKEWEKYAWFLWLCVLFPSFICVALKILFGRARPDLWFTDHLYGFYGVHVHDANFWSFPSGHTTTVMGLAFGLIALFPRYSWAFLLFGLFVVSSRVLLTHHYLSDVLIASYLAFLEIGLLFWWFKRKGLIPRQNKNQVIQSLAF